MRFPEYVARFAPFCHFGLSGALKPILERHVRAYGEPPSPWLSVCGRQLGHVVCLLFPVLAPSNLNLFISAPSGESNVWLPLNYSYIIYANGWLKCIGMSHVPSANVLRNAASLGYCDIVVHKGNINVESGTRTV